MSASALLFGDELTPLNATGIAIAFCGQSETLLSFPQFYRNIFFFVCPGIVLFTYHKYSKSLESTVPVDTHGNPVEEDDIDIVEEEYTPGAFGLEESQTFNNERSREITLVCCSLFLLLEESLFIICVCVRILLEAHYLLQVLKTTVMVMTKVGRQSPSR